jgi:hypothetical protein
MTRSLRHPEVSKPADGDWVVLRVEDSVPTCSQNAYLVRAVSRDIWNAWWNAAIDDFLGPDQRDSKDPRRTGPTGGTA